MILLEGMIWLLLPSILEQKNNHSLGSFSQRAYRQPFMLWTIKSTWPEGKLSSGKKFLC